MTQLDISALFPSEWVEVSVAVIFRGEEEGNGPCKRRIWKMGLCVWVCVCLSVYESEMTFAYEHRDNTNGQTSLRGCVSATYDALYTLQNVYVYMSYSF